MRRNTNPLRCEHVFKLLISLSSSPKAITELQLETRISPAAFYNTVIPSLKELELVEETYEQGKHNSVKRIIKITEKGRKLIETLMEIWSTAIIE
ncbi:hypothetical protein [Acidianus manzaensis]|uniref:ArnR1-like winged helix-turn-helix domain-containing protein n=1 Tax=Acidianus manzaensis TaxID=282676 RepID=A0A1W6K0K7_9CREN|nr:hypothetical protein [Acidianus manzaensis]ARM76111.1 hypothetical protein B6F84_08800 [Acidianus manzaensis]